MKTMTIGASPYLLTSDGQLNALILEHFYAEDTPIASVVWGHDITYHIPEVDSGGKQHYYYEFNYNGAKHKIPIVPIKMEGIEYTARIIYELLKLFSPEMVVTVGTFNDFLYMQAVKEFCPNDLKWLAILANHTHPINEHNHELTHYMDGVLCTNHFSYQMIRELSPLDNIDVCYVGVDQDLFFPGESGEGCRVMSCGKNSQSDNLPVLMEAVRDLQSGTCPDMSLYLHGNVMDTGDYDMSILRSRFDPNKEFIQYPSKSVSLSDGYSTEDYRRELASSDIFVSTAMSSATCLSIFEAIACGCVPLMTDTPCSREIAEGLAEYLEGFNREDFLLPSVAIMTTGETYLYVCDPEGVRQKLASMYTKLSKNKGQIKGLRQFIATDQENSSCQENESTGMLSMSHEAKIRLGLRQFIATKDRKRFLMEITSMVLKVKETPKAICLDAV